MSYTEIDEGSTEFTPDNAFGGEQTWHSHRDCNPLFKAGWDSVANGATTENCHFTLFSTKARMEEWSRGVRAAKEAVIRRQLAGTE